MKMSRLGERIVRAIDAEIDANPKIRISEVLTALREVFVFLARQLPRPGKHDKRAIYVEAPVVGRVLR